MNAKMYLNSIKVLDEKIDEKILQIDCLRAMATSTSVEMSADRVQTSIVGDKFAECIAKAADLSKEVDEDVDRLYDLKKECIGLICKMKNDNEQTVLMNKYLQYDNFGSIADEIGRSIRQVMRIHKKALENFQKILDDEGL